MEPSWKHADVFPIIAHLIGVPEIAVRLLEDTAGRKLVEAAHKQQGERQSLAWVVSNMVLWFSQRITVGESDWARDFERNKIDGFWAYQPVDRGKG